MNCPFHGAASWGMSGDQRRFKKHRGNKAELLGADCSPAMHDAWKVSVQGSVETTVP